MKRIIRVGSRESLLAVTQSKIIIDIIHQTHTELELQLITMKTSGDKILNAPLDIVGGKGLFVKELDHALLRGEIDLAIHSLKDMPMAMNEDLPIVAFSKREDPRDALILSKGVTLPLKGGIVGTSSKRRALQLKRLYPGITCKDIRGNVQTRLRKLEGEDYAATVLAKAGLKRLGMEHTIGRLFAIEEMLPAAGQGILAVQGRKGEDYSYLMGVSSSEAKMAALVERQFVLTLDGDCSSPVAAYAQVKGEEIWLRGLYYDEAAEDFSVGEMVGTCSEGRQLGEKLALKLKARWQ